MSEQTPRGDVEALIEVERIINDCFRCIETQGSKVHDADGNLTGVYISADWLRKIRAMLRRELVAELAQQAERIAAAIEAMKRPDPPEFSRGFGVGQREAAAIARAEARG